MTRIYLIRHAQAEGNLYHRLHGWFDGHVTQLGRRQIAALEQRFADIPVDGVYASGLSRAMDTAQAVAGPRRLRVRVDDDLREIGMGVYEDVTFGDLDYHHPDANGLFFAFSPQWAPQGGETFQQVAARMTAAVFRIAQACPGQTVALVSHGTAIHCLQAALRGKRPWEAAQLPWCGNTGVSCYEVEGDRFRILFENDVSHLPVDAIPGESRGPYVWFRPVDLGETDKAKFYCDARKEAWEGLHGSLRGFDGPGFLAEAREQLQWDDRAVQEVMLRGKAIGVLQLATLQGVRDGAGYVSFVYLRPDYRRRGIGGQLVGQAVCTYRPMGRRCLRLLCDPGNEPAQQFYRRHGFVRTGQAPGALGPLDKLEKPL